MKTKTLKRYLKDGLCGAAVVLALVLCISLPAQAVLTEAQQTDIQTAIDNAIADPNQDLTTVIMNLITDPTTGSEIAAAALGFAEANPAFSGSISDIINGIASSVGDLSYTSVSGTTYTIVGGVVGGDTGGTGGTGGDTGGTGGDTGGTGGGAPAAGGGTGGLGANTGGLGGGSSAQGGKTGSGY